MKSTLYRFRDNVNTIGALLMMFVVFHSCGSTGNNSDDYGKSPTAGELSSGAKKQKDSIGKIQGDATNIKETSPKKEIKAKADNIIKEGERLKDNIVILEKAAEGKSAADAKIALITKEKEEVIKERDEWKEKYEGKMSKIFWLLKVGGVLAIPLGLFLMLKVSGEFVWLSIGGVLLILTGYAVEFIERNFPWILGGIFIAGVFAVLRPWWIERKVSRSAIRRTEILKEEVKKIDDETITKANKRGTEMLQKVFGSFSTDGVLQNDAVTNRIINKERKKFYDENKPVVN